MKLSAMPTSCALCSAPLALPFFRLRLDHVLPKPQAAREVLGLTAILGATARALPVAEALAPDADVALCAGDEAPQLTRTAYVCTECACMQPALARMLS